MGTHSATNSSGPDFAEKRDDERVKEGPPVKPGPKTPKLWANFRDQKNPPKKIHQKKHQKSCNAFPRICYFSFFQSKTDQFPIGFSNPSDFDPLVP